MIKIEKQKELTTLKREIKKHTFLVNGHEVRVEEDNFLDIVLDSDDKTVVINEDDLNYLSDVEREIFSDDIAEWLALEVGKSEEVYNEEID